MAIGWLTVFKAIPWSDVVAAAPTVVKGARKLVDAVRKRGGEGEALDGPEGEAAADPAARMRQLEARIEELEGRQQAAVNLMESMAEQQEKLVSAVEVLRLRSKFLLLMCLVLALGAVLALTR
jgi:TolA-binding protein